MIIFLFLNKNICCGYSLKVPLRGTSNEHPRPMCFGYSLELPLRGTLEVPLRDTSKEFPQHMILLKNKKKYK